MATLNTKKGQLDYWPDPFNPPDDGLPDENDPVTATVGARTVVEDQPPPEDPPEPEPPNRPTPPPPPTPGPNPWDPGLTTIGSLPPGGNPTTPGPDPYDTEISNHIKQWTASHTGFNPSVTRDPTYWARRIRETHPNGNPDWGYWESRFMQPEGPPEGSTNTQPPGTRLGMPNMGPNGPFTRRGTGPHGEPIFTGPDGKLYTQGFEGMVPWSGADPGSNTGGTNDGPGGDTSPLSGFLQQLMSRANSLMDLYSKPVSGSDPNIRNVTDAYHGRTARSLSSYRERMAERAHAEGVPTGAFDAQLGNAETTAGRSESELEAQLVNMENQNRRQALTSMFGGATSLGLGDKGLNIQDFLGRGGLSNQLLLGTGSLANQNLGINNQNKQFYDQLAWLMSQYGPNMDSVLTQLLLGGR